MPRPRRGLTISRFNRYLGGAEATLLPVPMMNILNGGVHADNPIDFQEFMIAPIGAPSFAEALRMGVEVFHALKHALKGAGHNTNVGDEGGFAPNLASTRDALDFVVAAIAAAGFKLGEDVFLALDVAATRVYAEDRYFLKGEGRSLDAKGMIAYYTELASKYPICSIEDGCAEDDWEGWKLPDRPAGQQEYELVGDNVFVTNTKRLQRGIDSGVANSHPHQGQPDRHAPPKPSKRYDLARRNGYSSVTSPPQRRNRRCNDRRPGRRHGHGPNQDRLSLATDRMAEYNQLLRIEEILGEAARYAGRSVLNRGPLTHA